MGIPGKSATADIAFSSFSLGMEEVDQSFEFNGRSVFKNGKNKPPFCEIA